MNLKTRLMKLQENHDFASHMISFIQLIISFDLRLYFSHAVCSQTPQKASGPVLNFFYLCVYVRVGFPYRRFFLHIFK